MAPGKPLLQHIEQLLTSATSLTVKITGSTSVSGGSINQVYCLQTNRGKYLLKTNSATAYPKMFALEAEGLNTIATTNTVYVPGVIAIGNAGDESFLLLEWVDSGQVNGRGSAILGEQLAEMHRHTHRYFGFDHDNYMGSLNQRNNRHSTWGNFYIHERLMPMVQLALDKGLLNSKDSNNFEQLYAKLANLFDEEPPSLIHGDLWGGNYIIDMNNQPYLVDPAVSYGHREFDIAMTTLFGGFQKEFYLAYNNTFPLAKGWQQRLDLWNLYPLLVHVNLFGSSYVGQVRDCLNQYL